MYQVIDPQLIAFLNDPKTAAMLAILVAWSLVWKGIALWKAAGNKNKVWFIVLLVLNTVGILEIVYTFYFSKKENKTAV